MQYVVGVAMNPMRQSFKSIVQKIRDEIRFSNFDCRPQMLRYEHPENEWNLTEEFLKGYILPKYAVAKVLQPKRICEIGVYCGVAALAFLGACPTAEYAGIDDLSGQKALGVDLVSKTGKLLDSLGYTATIFIENSQLMYQLPGDPYDLIHVDGCHTREAAKHDVMLAWGCLKLDGYLLVDDSCDCHVCAGVFDALLVLPGGNVYWTNLEGTTGSILIYRTRQ